MVVRGLVCFQQGPHSRSILKHATRSQVYLHTCMQHLSIFTVPLVSLLYPLYDMSTSPQRSNNSWLRAGCSVSGVRSRMQASSTKQDSFCGGGVTWLRAASAHMLQRWHSHVGRPDYSSLSLLSLRPWRVLALQSSSSSSLQRASSMPSQHVPSEYQLQQHDQPGLEQRNGGQPSSRTHLIVFVNGLFGSPSNWTVVCEQLQQRLDMRETLLHPSQVNAR